ncbi:MAG: accessory gene regulator B family protein [Oscillospiraceae bacterium]
MKELVIGSSLCLIKKYCPEYDEIKLEEIKYGLSSLYLTITKTIVICAIAFILGYIKELLIFTVIYNVIRMPSFGLHATTSLSCLISSTILFIGIPYLCTLISIPIWMKLILGTIGVLLIYKNSPADTEKRPIVSPKRRKTYKLLSTIVAIIFVTLSITIQNDFISNCFTMALILQCFIVSPTIYKLFGLPYDNYKNYNHTVLN